MTHRLRWALTPLVLLALSACGGDEKAAADGVPQPSNRTLTATLDGAGDLAVLDRVVDNAGLGTVLEGKGPYTVLAPSDAAFTAGAAGTDFADAAQRAPAAALLRAHILPGALTRTDILTAIEAAGADGAQMRTMADTLLTFTLDGETIVVTAPDGAQARLTGTESAASNGVVQPIDGLLLQAAPAPVA